MVKKIITSLLLIFVIVGLVLYTSNNQDIQDIQDTQDTQENLISIVFVDYPETTELEILTKESDIVVIGHYDKFIESWNMARNPKDITQEDPNMYVEGRIYSFDVKKYLEGTDDKTINVNLSYSRNGELYDYYIEPQYGEEVMLFLKKDINFNNYYPTMEPFEFTITDNKLDVKSNIEYIRNSFKNKNISINDVEIKLNK